MQDTSNLEAKKNKKQQQVKYIAFGQKVLAFYFSFFFFSVDFKDDIRISV